MPRGRKRTERRGGGRFVTGASVESILYSREATAGNSPCVAAECKVQVGTCLCPSGLVETFFPRKVRFPAVAKPKQVLTALCPSGLAETCYLCTRKEPAARTRERGLDGVHSKPT